MRKVLFSSVAALALIAGSVGSAKAADPLGLFAGGEAVSSGSVAMTTLGVLGTAGVFEFVMVKAVIDCASGKYNCTTGVAKTAEAYQQETVAAATPNYRYGSTVTNVAAVENAKRTHDYNVAMGYADDAQTTVMLASAK